MLLLTILAVLILGVTGMFTFYIANKYGKEDKHHHV